ncbi:hypothetical protein MSMAC_1691 [Methanosarcina mazei C16]|uniref:Uncharacterized protein n=1 Tax=Methanosarcina mazei C16 TaxID=1434113 RepID=A0A0E3RW65_METMZ|nr:hypothetical protein MSMAC_1691 [Methanosarcina mazei C16]
MCMAVPMGMLMKMRMLVRMYMRISVGKYMREKMRGETGIKKPVMLMILFTGLFRSVFFIMQITCGILSGHLSPSF